jgi:hypothetical protein
LEIVERARHSLRTQVEQISAVVVTVGQGVVVVVVVHFFLPAKERGVL